MIKNADGTYTLTQDEINTITEFSDLAFYTHWDHYTDHFLTKRPQDEIMRDHDPEMYDLVQELKTAFFDQ